MKLVLVTQVLDESDPVLGATVAKVRALARHADEVVVLALRVAPGDLPPNVRAASFGGAGKLARAARLVRLLAAETRGGDVAVLAHMAPVYAVLAAPVTRPRRIPLLLWFTHWRRSPTLRLAERLSTRVLSVDTRSFPVPSRKLVPVGHGIDTAAIPPAAARADDGVVRLLALGRTSPAKGLRTIVDAVDALDGIELEIRGPSLTAEERAHRDALRARGARVEDPVPYVEVPSLLARADALVNNMRAGALDKVVFEAAAAGLPVLVASEGFDTLVERIEPPLRFRQDDAVSLAKAIEGLVAAGPGGRRAAGERLRERVERDHSVDHWARAVLEAAR